MELLEIRIDQQKSRGAVYVLTSKNVTIPPQKRSDISFCNSLVIKGRNSLARLKKDSPVNFKANHVLTEKKHVEFQIDN